jgi:glycerol uptake facilitator-like aquaporin
MTSGCSRRQRVAAEALGSALLLATVIGSGIMGERLSGGNVALALLSGAHFNPAVTTVFALREELPRREVLPYVLAQLAGAVIGVLAAHAMFEVDLLQVSTKLRAGPAQWLSEAIATFGLVTVILLTLRAKPEAAAASVALYITAAYWFTASTSFANPAVTVARALSNSFAGIRPIDVLPFIAAQVLGAMLALHVCRLLADHRQR